MTIKVKKMSRRKKFSIKGFLGFLISIFSFALLILIFMPQPSYKECFKSLSDIQKYASITNENTPMETNDTVRPEFTNYYKTLKPSFLQNIKNKAIWLLSKINLAQSPVWDIGAFKTILEELGTSRQKSGMKDNFVYRIQVQPNAKIVVFGNLQGSFHSFVRCLTKLKEIGIIDDSLKIIQPQNFIMLMGDVIDRSPFTLETLTLAMRLVQINPNNFLYLRGNHESNNYWQEHTLKTELQIRAKYLSSDSIPLEKEINLFFNSLPIAAYLTIPNSVNDFVRLSDAGRPDSTILNENNFADTLTKKTDAGVTYFAIKENSEASAQKVNIKVIIRGEKKRKTFQKNEGLRLLAPDLDSVAWNVLSCPNVVYQKALDFYFDAFAVITVAEKFYDWEIALFSRDLRTKDPFKEVKYNLVSGLDIEAHKKMASNQAQQQTQQIVQPTQQPQQQQVAAQAVQTVQPQTIAPAQQNIQPVQQQPIPQTQPPITQTQTPVQQTQQAQPTQQPQLSTQPQVQTQTTMQQIQQPPQQPSQPQQPQTQTTQKPQQLLQTVPEVDQPQAPAQQTNQPQAQQLPQPNQTENKS